MSEYEYLQQYAREHGEKSALENAADTIEKLRRFVEATKKILDGLDKMEQEAIEHGTSLKGEIVASLCEQICRNEDCGECFWFC